MLVRIVKMKFQEKMVEQFLTDFNLHKYQIRNFPGCKFLELYRDLNDPTIFFTYSYWTEEEDLETYRNSELFRSVWTITKPLFSDKPEAWSVIKHESLS
ncbi:putative quinol monooxygenase [Aegicerativicinus sediminis]|uniref:putative quinol monooxygenase n=1 Tax=Aegicerativicinus sediminis TaxID=2893202 RepID=UPI001E3E474A|nr:antibiotic biosynthesis monooxygenase [Aegicerativicinus sediminis]